MSGRVGESAAGGEGAGAPRADGGPSHPDLAKSGADWPHELEDLVRQGRNALEMGRLLWRARTAPERGEWRRMWRSGEPFSKELVSYCA